MSISRAVANGTFTWRSYVVARITRIYPLFMLGLLLAIIAWWLTDGLDGEPAQKPWVQLFSSLLSLQVFTSTFPTFNPSWSLSNEMLYYAIWPLIFFAVQKRSASAFFLAVFSTFALCLLIGVLWLGLHLFETSAAVHGLWSVSILFPLWLGGAWLADNWNSISAAIGRRLWWGSFLFCLVSEIILAWARYHDAPQSVVDFVSLISLPGIVLLLGGARHARLGSFPLAQPCIRRLGNFSYPCYVLHMPLQIMIVRLVIPRLPDGFTAHPLMHALTLLLPVLLVLAVVGPWLETSIMAWRSKVLSRIKS